MRYMIGEEVYNPYCDLGMVIVTEHMKKFLKLYT